MLELLLKYWPIVSGMIVWGIGITIFIIRLEGKVRANERAITLCNAEVDKNDKEVKTRDLKLDADIKERDKKLDEKLDRTFNKMFDLIRDMTSSLDKLIGWKEAKNGGG